MRKPKDQSSDQNYHDSPDVSNTRYSYLASRVCCLNHSALTSSILMIELLIQKRRWRTKQQRYNVHPINFFCKDKNVVLNTVWWTLPWQIQIVQLLSYVPSIINLMSYSTRIITGRQTSTKWSQCGFWKLTESTADPQSNLSFIKLNIELQYVMSAI